MQANLTQTAMKIFLILKLFIWKKMSVLEFLASAQGTNRTF